MNCIFLNDSQKQKISLLKPHPKVIQIMADNSKNNVDHEELAKNVMENDASAVKLAFTWLEEYKPFDEI